MPGDHGLSFLDLPGHGLASADRTPIGESGAALAGLGGAGIWICYSMGARFALHAALAQPNQIEGLVLIGATPGIESASERTRRRELDDERAERIDRNGVSTFLTEWLSTPMFARLPVDAYGLAHRQRNDGDGLASSLRLAGTGAQESLWGRLGEIDVPVLLIAGEHDSKFVDIGERMATSLPNGQFHSIPSAGHAAHTEQPDAVAAAVRSWVTR